MLRLSPEDDNAYQRRRELSAKLFQARIALKHADDQLQGCYQEFSRGSLGQQ